MGKSRTYTSACLTLVLCHGFVPISRDVLSLDSLDLLLYWHPKSSFLNHSPLSLLCPGILSRTQATISVPPVTVDTAAASLRESLVRRDACYLKALCSLMHEQAAAETFQSLIRPGCTFKRLVCLFKAACL